jgi:hypothetical protein
VIDSTGFNTRTWLDPIGAPHSDKLRITRIAKLTWERYRASVMMTTIRNVYAADTGDHR